MKSPAENRQKPTKLTRLHRKAQEANLPVEASESQVGHERKRLPGTLRSRRLLVLCLGWSLAPLVGIGTAVLSEKVSDSLSSAQIGRTISMKQLEMVLDETAKGAVQTGVK